LPPLKAGARSGTAGKMQDSSMDEHKQLIQRG